MAGGQHQTGQLGSGSPCLSTPNQWPNAKPARTTAVSSCKTLRQGSRSCTCSRWEDQFLLTSEGDPEREVNQIVSAIQ